MPHQWNDATIKVLHKKKKKKNVGQNVATIVASPPWLTPAKYSSKSSRVALGTAAIARTFGQRNSVGSDPNGRRLTLCS